MPQQINVTRSSMPPFEEYVEEIRPLWESRWLTNMGEKHCQLEQQLAEKLGAGRVSLFTNGHMALELNCVSVGSVEVRRVDSIELDEENGFDLSQYPAVTLVRAGDETMWELAKEYHSSVEKISAANPAEDAAGAGLLLIPKCV